MGTFHVLPRNTFGLVANVGADSAGLIPFVRPEQLDAVRLGAPQEVQWLDEAADAERLRALRHDQAAWRIPRDTGLINLAGAQPKTANSAQYPHIIKGRFYNAFIACTR